MTEGRLADGDAVLTAVGSGTTPPRPRTGRGRRPFLCRFSNCAAFASLEKLSANYNGCGLLRASFSQFNFLPEPAAVADTSLLETTRATVEPITAPAPAFLSTRERASSVAPVVITSLISRTRRLSTRSPSGSGSRRAPNPSAPCAKSPNLEGAARFASRGTRLVSILIASPAAFGSAPLDCSRALVGDRDIAVPAELRQREIPRLRASKPRQVVPQPGFQAVGSLPISVAGSR